ncbi:MAG: hypothetical protein ING19_13920 [Azospirillum sp.]|nr:hypothetical protein [Azospirillum sp.]
MGIEIEKKYLVSPENAAELVSRARSARLLAQVYADVSTFEFVSAASGEGRIEMKTKFGGVECKSYLPDSILDSMSVQHAGVSNTGRESAFQTRYEVRIRREIDIDPVVETPIGSIETTLAIKGPKVGGKGFEYETKLDANEHLSRLVEGIFAAGEKKIEKIRYLVPSPIGTIEMDRFRGDLTGLTIAEIEFASESDFAAAGLPGFAARDVTEDKRFSNANLAFMTPAQKKSLVAVADSIRRVRGNADEPLSRVGNARMGL